MYNVHPGQPGEGPSRGLLVIVKTGFGTDGSLVRVLGWCCGWTQGEAVSAAPGPLEAATLGWGLTAVRRHHRSPPPPPAPSISPISCR